MARRSVLRRGSVVLALVLGVVGLVLVPTSPALADFASQCATPDRTVSAGAPSIAVGVGETVLVDSAYVGGIDALPATATLCVGPGATLTVEYMNNAAGALVVAPGASLVMPSVAVAAGFSLDVAGTATFAGLNVNGAADFHVAPAATMTVSSSLSPAGGAFVNEGTFTVEGDLSLNSSVSFRNAARLTVRGNGNVNGPFDNAGFASFTGGLTINSSGSLDNRCSLDAAGALMNNSATSENDGVARIRGSFTNNGRWRQSHLGVLGAVGFDDNGTVSGFGVYGFSGRSTVNGFFEGDSAAEPIRVQSVAPPGQIFDVENGTITNTVRAPSVRVPDFTSECANPSPPSLADVVATKVGPATAEQGETITYTVHVSDVGPADAQDVVVRDALPSGFTLDPASTTGAVVGGDLVWDVGVLRAGDQVSLTFSGAVVAAVGSILENVTSATSSSPDPDLTNNDGSAEASRVRTLVVAATPPPDNPPVAHDLTLDTITGEDVGGVVTATDPDLGEKLTFVLDAQPPNGKAYLSATGGLAYTSNPDFAGIETFTFTVCDNAATPACDSGLVTINVRPRATDDVAQTFEATPVVVPVLSNDTQGAPLDPVAVTAPLHGVVALDQASRTARYTPADGFIGTDSFEYRICAPTPTTFCDTALVTVTVVDRNDPPIVDPLLLVTTATVPVSGELVTADPNGDAVSTYRGVPSRTGSEVVALDGSTTYAPSGGFAGRDQYGVFACDDGVPQLCGTARVKIEVLPVAAPDSAQTTAGTAVQVDVATNDVGLVGPPTIASPPTNGTVTFTGTVAQYVPAAAFSGTDTFTYTICATTAPDLCSTTTVTVVVSAATVVPEPPNPVVPTPTPSPSEPPSAGEIAATGAAPAPLLLLGLGLLLGGGMLTLVARRRT